MTNAQNPAEISFGIYGSVGSDLETALARNRADAAASDTPAPGLSGAISDALGRSPAFVSPQPEVRSWAADNLESLGDKWKRYFSDAPESLEDLARTHPNYEATMARLHRTRQDIIASGATGAGNLNVGEHLSLVLVPWQQFRTNIDWLASWVMSMRSRQGLPSSDFFPSDLMPGLRYRDPANPHNWPSVKDYLDQRIAYDGPWGVMLMQTSAEIGIRELENKSPAELTSYCESSIQIAGHAVDHLGIIEWLAFTLQEDPRKFFSGESALLIASQHCRDGVVCVPHASWSSAQQQFSIASSAEDIVTANPRLAVL